MVKKNCFNSLEIFLCFSFHHLNSSSTIKNYQNYQILDPVTSDSKQFSRSFFIPCHNLSPDDNAGGV